MVTLLNVCYTIRVEKGKGFDMDIMDMDTDDYLTLYRGLILEDCHSALQDFSKAMPEKNRYEVGEYLSDERTEKIQEAEHLENRARQLRYEIQQLTEGINKLTANRKCSINQ
jgi:hypothetical protein